ncbi:MAG TPA: hypothetical protein VLG37_01945 [Candidatus Saccharimonadales bacterium]|nr:hypothetical protein [Candidatus Saccharimonadales bacterium]
MKRVYSTNNFYVVLAILYVILTLLLPSSHATRQTYHLSSLQYHVLLLLVILPVLLIWFAAFYGYAKLQEYAHLIQDTTEGPDYQRIASGVKWLAWGIPIPSFVSLVLNAITDSHPGFRSPSIIVSIYLNLLIPLVAFTLISTGTRGLLDKARIRLRANEIKLTILAFVVIGVGFCYLIFQHLDLRYANSARNPYYLPLWLVITTITIPYLYTWMIGLLSCYEMHLIAKQTKGVLYQKAIRRLSVGLVSIIGTSIALQYLRSLMPRSGYLALGVALIMTYLVLVLAAIGYALIAYGAKKLKKIEEV